MAGRIRPDRRHGPTFERIGHLVRALVKHLASTDVPNDDVAALADAVEPFVTRFDRMAPRPPRSPELPDARDLQRIFSGDPVIGVRNPVAPPVRIEVDGTDVRGTCRLGRQYEGPPGYVHGGVIAGIFDQMLGLANIASGNPGFTGTLKIRYVNPTPLDTDLVFEARTTGSEGRKVFAAGTAHAGERLTAEAEGIFVQVGPERAAEYFGHTWGA